jgi:hypothetical protein
VRIQPRFLVAAWFLIFTAVSCVTRPERVVDLALRNGTAADLTRVTLVWSEWKFPFGTLRGGDFLVYPGYVEMLRGLLPPTDFQAILNATSPAAATSDTAYLKFTEQTDKRAAKQERTIAIDASALKQLPPGRYVITFTIKSFTEAKLQVDFK